MAPTKLSADDKKAIVQLYQAPGQTAATVAEEYGVSVSTISRLLRNELPAETYESLVRQKRGGGETRRKTQTRVSTKKPVSKPKKARAEAEELDETLQGDSSIAPPLFAASEAGTETQAESQPLSRRRRRSTAPSDSEGPRSRRPVSRRKRSLASEEPPVELPVETASSVDEADAPPEEAPAAPTPTVDRPIKRRAAEPAQPRSRRRRRRSTADLETALEDEGGQETASDETLQAPVPRQGKARVEEAVATASLDLDETDLDETDLDETDLDETDLDETDLDVEVALEEDDEAGDEAGEDFDDVFDDDDFEDDDEEDTKVTSLRRRTPSAESVQILPLAEANLSRMLYLVIDRTADLITMPMQHFSDLGQLPAEEEDRQTLPVFENHRVARRFSQRNQRVIKVPDGEMISKTASWLEAKGITRCLLDGQVYSLESADLN